MSQRRKIIWEEKLVGHMTLFGAEVSKIYGHWQPVLQKLTNGEDVLVNLEADSRMVECLVTSIAEEIIEMRIL